MKEKSGERGIVVIRGIFGLMVFGVCLYFALGELLPLEHSLEQYSCTAYSDGWNWVKEDGTRSPVQIPGKYDAGRNELVVIENTLPEELDSGTYLCFRSCKQETQIYVDGILRKTYSTNDTRLFGKTSAVAYVFLKLEPEDAGKKIVIETQTDSSYTGVFQECYYGDRMGIWHFFFKRGGMELIIAFFMLILGVLSILVSVVLRRFYHKRLEMEYFGWGVFLAAIWLIANSSFRQILFPSVSVISDMAFFMIMLMPLAFLLFMDGVQNGRYRRMYVLAGIFVTADFLVCTALHVTNRVDFADTILYMAVVCALSILLMIVTMLVDVGKGYVKEYSSVAVGIAILSLAAAAQIIMYFRRTVPFNGSVIALGLVFMLVISAVNSMQDVVHMEREKQQAMLSNETKGKFLANMSHEIRTPINAILGMNQMVLREAGEPVIREYAMDIHNAGQNLLSIVNDILDFSKIESGKMELVPVQYDFSSVIHDVVNMIQAKAQNKNLALHVNVDPSIPFCLYGDEVRIRQILLNLMTNAVKYTHEGGVSLTVGGELRENTVLLHFSVEDTGIGIREEDLPQLFEEFKRIEEQKNRNIEGTGLGMNITIQLLTLMGSHLDVESTYGKGTVFSFCLEQPVVNAEPIGDLGERIRQMKADYHYDARYIAPEARILVVDDNEVNRRVLINLLKETKIRIDEADSGVQCLERIRQSHYDIIFLDHMMPDMDGVETLHHMRKEKDGPCRDTPIVALTANAVSGAKEMYLSEGFDEFLSKPIIPEKLEKLVWELLPRNLIQGNVQNDSVTRTMEKKEMPEFPDIEGIDWSYGWLHMPDETMLMSAVRDFYRTMDSEALCLEECYGRLDKDEDAIRQYRIKVHAMKSSALLIGAVPIGGMAAILEGAAREGSLKVIEALTPAFLEEWRRYKERIKAVIVEDKEKVMEDDARILSCLQALGKAMEEMDIDTADEKMEWLRGCLYSADIQEDMEQLDAAVANLDSNRTGELVERLMNKIQLKKGTE